jgi:hypothetical protein
MIVLVQIGVNVHGRFLHTHGTFEVPDSYTAAALSKKLGARIAHASDQFFQDVKDALAGTSGSGNPDSEPVEAHANGTRVPSAGVSDLAESVASSDPSEGGGETE